MLSDELVFDLGNASRADLIVHKDGRVFVRCYDSDLGYPVDDDITDSQLARLLRPVLLKSGLLEAKLLEAALLEGPLNVTLHNVMNGMNGNSNVTLEAAATNSKRHTKGNEGKSLLTQATTQTLLSGGIPPDEVRYFGSLNGCANALNNSTNPVSAAKTMAAKPGFRDRLAAFLKKSSAAPPPNQFRDTIPEEEFQQI